MRFAFSVLALAMVVSPLAGRAEDLIPAKRFVLTQGVDRPGGDIATVFDTTQQACEQACIANDSCTEFTFNTAKGACFIKKDAGAETAYSDALSGRVLSRSALSEALAGTRRAELGFVQDWEMEAVTGQAYGLADAYRNDGVPAPDRRSAAADAEARGDADSAYRHMADAANLTGKAADWSEFARLLLLAAQDDQTDPRALREQAFWASANGYLRAEKPAQQRDLLVLMAQALEGIDRGSDSVKALRLADAVAPDGRTADLLAEAAGKYGFRVIENRVEAETARPRLCATLSEDLVSNGIDYADFVRVPDAKFGVTASGRDICVTGFSHGETVGITLRQGLPAADGQSLAKSIEITSYIRDRSPAVRFPGRAYVLPRSGDPALPVETVNTSSLDLTLFRVTDRNLIASVQNGYLSAPLADWQEFDFAAKTGTEVWRGTATVGIDLNRDVTTRLPMADALSDQPAGVFALKASVPGADPYETPAGWQFFTVSDLGITTLSGVDGLHVFVLSLGSAQPNPDVSLQLLSTGNEVLGTARTDATGHALFDAGLTRGTGSASAGMIVARDGEQDLAFLSLTDPEFDLSDRGVEGREASAPVDVFLTTDRGAYRAGETVHATALARDGDAKAVTGLPLTAILRRPDGIEYTRQLATDTAGGYVFSLPVAASAPRGVWRIDMLADLDAEPLTSRTLLVEDFLPERIDFDLALPDTPLQVTDRPSLTVDARYLFGAPGADLAVEGETLVRAATELAGWKGYRFGRTDDPFLAVVQPIEPARTDPQGKANIALAFPPIEQTSQPLEAVIAVRLAEGSGRPVERQIVKPIVPAHPIIGLKPLFEDVLPENGEARFTIVGVGTDGASSVLPVKWTLTRIETRYQWYQTFGSWNWEPVITRSLVKEGALTVDGPTEISAAVKWGEYELAVERSDGTPASSSLTFSAGWYAAADVTSTPDTLELSLDKPAYAAGDTATLRLVPRFAGTALVSVLSNRVIAMQAVPVNEGENTIQLPVTDDWGAGVYVTASVVRPMDVATGHNPSRALGLAHAGVDPGPRALVTEIIAPAEAAPRGPLDVSVKVQGIAPGETAYVTLAAVDQGILNLTAFSPPDPQSHYFGQRKLGVGIRDIYGRLIDGMNGAEGLVRSGGDAGAQARLQSPPPTEQLVAFFTGPVTVGADGLASVSFDIPAFNGAIKLMAVAWTATGVGQASADVLVRDPVVVTASLPRFLAPGDESRLLLEIVHATGPAGEMPLSVSATGLTLGDAPASVMLAPEGKAVIAIPVTAVAPGLHSIAVTLTTPDGKALAKTLTLPVETNAPEIGRVSRFDLKQGQTFIFDAAALDGLAPGARATLAIGPIARLNAPGVLAALDRYPYGCTEQMTSRAMPLLYLDSVARALDLPHGDDLRQRVAETITAILTNQGAEGGFGLWGAGSGDFWLDAFVTDFLSRARSTGFEVPDTAYRLALDNLRNQVNYAADFDAGGEALAYALYVLAREGGANIGDLRYYADAKSDAFATPASLAQLGAALASYGDQTRADAMFRKAEAILAPDADGQVWRVDYGSPYRDAAALLALATEAGSQAIDREKITDRLATHSGPLSTQEATWTLLAARALGEGASGVLLDGAPADGPLVRLLGDVPVTVDNTGADTTLTLTSFGTPVTPEPAGGNGYAITRSYFTMDGSPADATVVKTGTRLVAVLEITPFDGGQARLMVTDPLPAGFEIDNPNLLSSGKIADSLGFDLLTETAHSEFRHDRFLSVVDRSDNQPFRLAYVVRAVTPGSYTHPAPSVEDMYQPDFRAHGDTGRVTVTE